MATTEPAWRQNRFYAAPRSIPGISKLLKCISFAEKVNIHISPSGMKLTVEEAKCLQVCVFLQKELFQIFHLLDDEDLAFKISLKELLECLKRMSPDGSRHVSRTIDAVTGAKMHFAMARNDHEFRMTLEEDVCESFFRIRIEEYDALIEFELVPVVVKIMMKAQELSEYFKTLEDVSPDIIGFKVSPQDPLIISADCQEGSVELILPSTADVVESFECSHSLKATYKLSTIRHAIRIMSLSSKCALKLDPRGILNVCFLIDEETESFVEYYCLPQVVDGDDELDI